MHSQTSTYQTNIQVADGAYNGMKLGSTDQAILSDTGLDKNIGYSVPLEIMPAGQFEPMYKTTLSVQVCSILIPFVDLDWLLICFFLMSNDVCVLRVKDGELPVLPLSVYGAVAMAHSDVSEEYSSPNQFFFYLYDKSYVSCSPIFLWRKCW